MEASSCEAKGQDMPGEGDLSCSNTHSCLDGVSPQKMQGQLWVDLGETSVMFWGVGII